MKRFWPRVLSAFTTLALGLVAASAVRLLPAASTSHLPPCGAAEVKERLTPHGAAEMPPPAETGPPDADPLSPYAIKRHVDGYDGLDLSLQGFWRRLGIRAEPWGTYVGHKAELFPLDLDGEPGDEVLLRVFDSSQWVSRVVVFKPPQAGHAGRVQWRVLGSMDFFDQKEYPPRPRVEEAGERRWLVLRSISDRGAGVTILNDTWYEAKGGRLKEVLDYPADGYVSFYLSDIFLLHTYDSDILEIGGANGETSITVRYSVSYESADCPGFGQEQTAVFVRRPNSAKFVLDRRRSGLSAKELKAIYQHDSLSGDVFLKYNHRALSRAAASGNAKQREWLRSYLETCGESPEKRSLLTALGEQP